MNQPWLKSYQAGVPATVNVEEYASVVGIYDEAFERYSDRVAAMNMGKSITYAQMNQYSKHVAAWLQQLGLQKGERVAIMMPNCLQYPILVAAILRAGYCVVNVNPLYTVTELTHQLNDSEAKAIFILENFASTLQACLPNLKTLNHIVVTSLGDLLGLKGHVVNFVLRHVKKMVPVWDIEEAESFKTVLSKGASLKLTPVQLGHDDLAFLQYTGGTTGVSKGATLTHGNLVANVLQADAWCTPGLDLDKNPSPVFVCALPLYHIFGLTACALYSVHLGGRLLLITNPRDVPAFIKELSKYPFSILPAVNTLFNALLNHPDFAKLDFSNLKVALGGGMAVQESVAEKFHQVTGVPICEAYGLSETSPAALFNPVNLTAFTGQTGLPMSSTDVAILDDNGQHLPLGETGEIGIRGPQVMRGYWKRDDETAKVMTADGYFKTGDIGIMNEQGYVKIVDRKKNMILVSGFNVYPNQIEDAAARHPKVLESAAIGVPDEHSGEVVKLFVVKKDSSLTESELMSFLKGQLTGYKRPKYIEFRADLPKSNVGKILHKDLREPKK
ncbi:long-chain-fatty-acid--CoA ligase [Hydromonas duriensis]|uniref:Long-chain-fatty-acid--CoA ligase n=1 Tax=Hydromonas duriensis TaxID=1527608 RepID=A0A4R6Y7U5_9BURK|nr:long-chain-fatty-acid--CoA ligase [Hydromonas duriensis]TDR31430.1 long-chain acyl-CoA synthetase [Hydromonas duriensis]